MGHIVNPTKSSIWIKRSSLASLNNESLQEFVELKAVEIINLLLISIKCIINI